MKNVMKRALALSIALVMLLTIVACTKKDADPTTPEPETEETTTPAPTDGDETPDQGNNGGTDGGNTGDNNGGDNQEDKPVPVPVGQDFVLVKDNVAQFAIVLKNKTYGYEAMAQGLADSLRAKTTAQFTVKGKPASSEKAIYIGADLDSFMPSSELPYVTYDGYVLREVNGNIHLAAPTKAGVQKAIDELLNAVNDETMAVDGTKITCTIPGSVLNRYNPEYAMRNATLLGKPISQFEIVLPQNYTVIERFAAEHLIEQIGHDTGYQLNYVKDSATASKPYRIVVGETALEYSATLYGDLAENSYHIKNSGNDLYVAYANYLVSMEIQAGVRALYAAESSATVDVTKAFDYSEYMLNKNTAPAENPNKVVRIMTSNIVAPGDENGQKDIEFKYGVSWQERMQIEGAVIMTYLPDFIGFQELQQGKVNGVTAYAHAELLKTIGDEYAFVYYDEVSKASHFTPIAYRKNVWNLEEKAVSSNLSNNHMHRWQWARFSLIEDPSVQYIVMNLHYPISSMTNERKLAGAAVHEEFLRLKALYPEIPVSIVGDFNAAFGTELFSQTVGENEEGIADTDLKTSYLATSDKFNTASIDHILVENDDVTVFNYRMVENGYIHMTSDHRPVIADVHIGKIIVPTPGPDIPWDEGEVQ